MIHPCQQCGYRRTEKDNRQTPEWQCPQCGDVTSKAERHERRQTPRCMTETQGMQRQNTIPRTIALGTLILGMGLGYLGGREHLKYEMRQVLAHATTSLQHVTQPLLPGPIVPNVGVSPAIPPTPPVSAQAHTMPVELVKKGFREADFSLGHGRDAVTLQLRFANTLAQDLRAFEGMLLVTDLLDNTIINLHLAHNEGVHAGASSDWQGTVDFNQFKEQDRRLRNAEARNIKLRFTLKKVLYSDGTTAEF